MSTNTNNKYKGVSPDKLKLLQEFCATNKIAIIPVLDIVEENPNYVQDAEIIKEEKVAEEANQLKYYK
jgi:nitrogen regulatory protein PII-like uncharacterized protein